MQNPTYMKNVSVFCFLYLLILSLPLTLSAQETLVVDKIYFQNEIIRKVSVGDNGIWVIKGADSTGVGKLEADGRELDYTNTVNSAFPLTGIVGKYGDSAMIATRGNYLLMYDKGTVSRLGEENGIRGNIINDISGSPLYSIIAGTTAAQESHDNQKFHNVNVLNGFGITGLNNGHTMLLSKKIEGSFFLAFKCENDDCRIGKKGDFHFCVSAPDFNTVAQVVADSKGKSSLNAVTTNARTHVFFGNESGLRTENFNYWGPDYHFLEDTTVFSLTPYYNNLILIGTERGLYYTHGHDPHTPVKVNLGNDYKVFDLCIDKREGAIWLATDKGLLKLKDLSFPSSEESHLKNLEWEKHVGGRFSDKANSSVVTKDGEVYVTGSYSGMVNFGDSTLIAQNSEDFFLAKYDADGKFLWVRTALNSNIHGEALHEKGTHLKTNSKGEVFLFFQSDRRYYDNQNWEIDFGNGKILNDGTDQRIKVVKYDRHGNFIWIRPLDLNPFSTFSFEIDQEDNFYLAISGTGQNYQMALSKYNKDLEVIWEKKFPWNFHFFNLKKNGGFYLSGYYDGYIKVDTIEFSNSDSGGNMFLVSFDKNGNLNWGKDFKNTSTSNISHVVEDRQGNTFISGRAGNIAVMIGNVLVQPGVYVAKINPLWEFDWVLNPSGRDNFGQAEVDSLGNFYIGSYLHENLEIDGKVVLEVKEGSPKPYFAKFNPYGKLDWAQKIPGHTFRISIKEPFVYLTSTAPGYPSVFQANDDNERDQDLFIAKIRDTTSYLNRNIVRGKAFFDKNKNDIYDEGDEPVRDNIIKALPGPVYAKSDPEGNYFLYLNEGQYSIEQIIPEYKGKAITQTFPSQPYQLTLSGTEADTTGFDFAHDVQLSPHLSVDLSSSRFRRCFENTTVVEYCNEGFADAENVQIVLEYPDYVIPVSSNFPWSSKSGKKITFNIGSLKAQHCKSITLTDSVMCGDESIRGLTQCIKATITPANIAAPDPAWDKSETELAAECKDNGFVRLTLGNNGDGNMADSAVFRIFLQEDLSYTGKYKLKKGESLNLNVLANGKPLHLEAELSPFHPHKKSVSISIHGCDDDGKPIVEHTFTNQFPQNDDQGHHEISCLEIIDSYDPNDKQVIPAGISAMHYVAEGSLLEYTIRFQNTGTDTAYSVVITDLLDKNMDISSLKVGLSSHPVKWELSGEEQANITWRFYHINLPDSTTNEKASHGFVKFKIRPKSESSFGTIIKNKAAIYFDYNSPIITNETLTTLGIPESTSAEKFTVQNCNVQVNLIQEEDAEVVLCETNSLQLSRLAPENGRGRWSIIKGEAKIKDKYHHNSLVEEISYGENIFQWEVSYCDVLVRSTIKVIREALPAAPIINPLPVLCQGDPLPALTAVGNDIRWYADPALNQLLGTGNTYKLKTLESGKIYVTQQNPLCESRAAIAEIKIRPKPAPPVAAASVEVCKELKNDFFLTADGNNLRWYSDQELGNLLGEGEKFQVKEKVSRSYFVTQSSEYCESDPTKLVLNTKAFDASKAFFANVITPNGDKYNEFFYVKPFETEECLGDFMGVKIYNRLGKMIYESKDRDFNWDAGKINPGVYFYAMKYELQNFNGTVQIIR